jgi:glycine cleavage system H protein
MMYPEDLRYSRDHVWVGQDGRLGITDYAQNSLGEIVYIEVPEIGSDVVAEQSIMEVESQKTATEILAPVSGKIVDVNNRILRNPEIVNTDPYGDGWFVKIEFSDPTELRYLLSSKEYQKMILGED